MVVFLLVEIVRTFNFRNFEGCPQTQQNRLGNQISFHKSIKEIQKKDLLNCYLKLVTKIKIKIKKKKKDKQVLNEGKEQISQNTKYKNNIIDFEKENKKLKEEVESYVTSG